MPWNWRKWYEYLGFMQECEEQEPGYTVGLAVFYLILFVGVILLAWDIGWKIQ